MIERMIFSNRMEFRAWLNDHCLSSAGVWLLFGKAGGPKTLKASEALEEALCFGWIDGQMQRIDDTSYQKYFALRRDNSKWSEKTRHWLTRWKSRASLLIMAERKLQCYKLVESSPM